MAVNIAELDKFRADMLAAHNHYRVLHGCSQLTTREQLNRGAQNWADTVAEAGFLQYSEVAGLGESILFVDVNGRRPCGQHIAEQWYRESHHYLFDQPRWRKDAIHFTQMVWRSTREMGVGVAKVRGQDRWVVVTQYRPQGNTNMPGDFSSNVLPLV